ncbi:MAG: restriction endonuclease [Melioribacteraceae bacterium]|nr:restriction endonuclease [Melioribacteraceae bacterium]
MSKEIKPKFLRFFVPLVDSLLELGGSGSPSEVIDLPILNMNISEKEQEQTNKNGGSTIINQAQWAKYYLLLSGYISSSQRGIWTLTEKATTEKFTEEKAIEIIKAQRQKYRDEKKKKSSAKLSQYLEPDPDSSDEIELLDVLKNLPPDGFERICQRLLRESGFQEVKVIGKSDDGGIDGYGILQINPLVSFNVLFQCKRYKGSVGSATIRDFRGAMLGRADKGIILTTGTFTADEKKEARRDGAPPIELVDGDKLVKMFQELKSGVIPKTVYEIDKTFFKEFERN